MKPKYAMPKRPADWWAEIANAFLDAAEAIPLGEKVGKKITLNDLFVIAPEVCLKFRGIEPTEKNRQKVLDAGLSSHVANVSRNEAILSKPQLGFAIAYVASHFGLGLLDEEAASDLPDYVERNEDKLLILIQNEEL